MSIGAFGPTLCISTIRTPFPIVRKLGQKLLLNNTTVRKPTIKAQKITQQLQNYLLMHVFIYKIKELETNIMKSRFKRKENKERTSETFSSVEM
jgi:hypothetical protein